MAPELNQNNLVSASPLVITRMFAAPRQLVWNVWTECEHISHWWGPKTFSVPYCKIDLRVGGKYLFCMRSPDGQDFWCTGTYLELSPYDRIVCTDSFADADGNVVSAAHYGMPSDFPLVLEVTLTFEEVAGGTRMTLRHAGMPEGNMREMTGVGWNESFDKLEAHLATIQDN